MRTLEEYIDLAEQAMTTIAYPSEPKGLYEPIAYGLSNGGKRLRPAILLAACEAVGKDCSVAVNQAAAIEMYHNFTLFHDDVMDNADIRRGKPTVCAKWDNNTAILSGDTLLTMASEKVITGIDAKKAVKLLQIFNRTAIEVYEGQQYDMEFENRTDVSIDEYINMIRLKTSVLLGGACRIGAELADATEEQSEALYQFAINLGLAFQLQDDLLDVYGDPEIFGKAIGGDIMNNKKTFLLINAMLLAKGDDAEELNYWLHNPEPLPGEKIAGVTAIYNRLGIDAICREAIEDYHKKSLYYIENSGLSKEAVDFFMSFAESLMNRKK